MDKKPISLIVVHYGNPELLWNLLFSLEHHSDKEFVDELLIVNNGLSLDKQNRVRLETYKNRSTKIVDNPEKSYASGVNRGAAEATGEVLLIANNDIEWLPSSSIRPLIEHLAQHPRVGVAGPQLLYPDESWQRSYGYFPSLKEALLSLTMLDSIWHGILSLSLNRNWPMTKRIRMVDYIDGAFMAVRRKCFEEVGGFDESYTFYGEDADFCFRVWKHGCEVAFVPAARIVHLRGATSSALDSTTVQLMKAKQKFVKDHYGAWRARWYGKLLRAALLERAILYGVIGGAARIPRWKQRASIAYACYRAVGGKGQC